MDTKWKNIKENAVKFFRRYYRRIVEVATMIGGIVFFLQHNRLPRVASYRRVYILWNPGKFSAGGGNMAWSK